MINKVTYICSICRYRFSAYILEFWQTPTVCGCCQDRRKGMGEIKKKRQLAAYIARKIFEVGDEIEGLGGKVHRIEFKGGSYPTNEIAKGGLNEIALTQRLHKILSDAEDELDRRNEEG